MSVDCSGSDVLTSEEIVLVDKRKFMSFFDNEEEWGYYAIHEIEEFLDESRPKSVRLELKIMADRAKE